MEKGFRLSPVRSSSVAGSRPLGTRALNAYPEMRHGARGPSVHLHRSINQRQIWQNRYFGTMPEVALRAEELKVRRAARILVIDAEGKVLLFEYSHSGRSEDALSDKGSYFTIPGGKALPGESYEECARRELEEETGITYKIPSLVLATRLAPLMMSSGKFVLADERYFAVFVSEAQAVDTSHWTTREKQNIKRVFWCSPSELAKLVGNNLWPKNLPEILIAARDPGNRKLPLSYKSESEQIGDVIVKVVY